MTVALDLGCGAEPRNPFDAGTVYGVDLVARPERSVSRADLVVEPIPFLDESVDFITAYDFIEHIPRTLYLDGERRHPFVELMNEIWRVLKPGGKFLSHTPAYPHAPAFRDPTHVNIISDETFPLYFDDEHCMARMYGFNGGFRIESQEWRAPWLVTIMVKP